MVCPKCAAQPKTPTNPKHGQLPTIGIGMVMVPCWYFQIIIHFKMFALKENDIIQTGTTTGNRIPVTFASPSSTGVTRMN